MPSRIWPQGRDLSTTFLCPLPGTERPPPIAAEDVPDDPRSDEQAANDAADVAVSALEKVGFKISGAARDAALKAAHAATVAGKDGEAAVAATAAGAAAAAAEAAAAAAAAAGAVAAAANVAAPAAAAAAHYAPAAAATTGRVSRPAPAAAAPAAARAAPLAASAAPLAAARPPPPQLSPAHLAAMRVYQQRKEAVMAGQHFAAAAAPAVPSDRNKPQGRGAVLQRRGAAAAAAAAAAPTPEERGWGSPGSSGGSQPRPEDTGMQLPPPKKASPRKRSMEALGAALGVSVVSAGEDAAAASPTPSTKRKR